MDEITQKITEYIEDEINCRNAYSMKSKKELIKSILEDICFGVEQKLSKRIS